ncbi:MAG TPA: hypothetical protein VHM91_09930 [Verrucomicrobiales bacterium]|nr:hypothetical protein [Verrucomicrobiales bacterium]
MKSLLFPGIVCVLTSCGTQRTANEILPVKRAEPPRDSITKPVRELSIGMPDVKYKPVERPEQRGVPAVRKRLYSNLNE